MTTEPRRQHLHVERDAEGLAWLTLDVAEVNTNTLDEHVLDELDRAFQALEAEPPLGAIIRSAKPGFCAGADVEALSQLETTEQARALIEQGQRVMDRIARASWPTVALVRGYCLGGGLELALACRYRVCDRDPGTRVGLPEVHLGIHPGFGGTARLPTVVGPVAALDLMLSGRTVDGRQARRLGMVDYALSPWQLDDAARDLIQRNPGRHQPPAWKRLLHLKPARTLLQPYMARQLRQKAKPEHYPAPYAVLDLWARHGGQALPARLRAEARSLTSMVDTPNARNLIRVFRLQDRLKQEGRRAQGQAPSRVHVIGAGTMGGDIAAWFALNGCRVTLYDERGEAIAATLSRAHRLYQRRLKRPERVQAGLDRLIPDPGGHGVDGADIVVEAIIEDLDAKRSLYAELEPRMRSDAVIATNTSSLPLEALAQGLTDPGRLIGLHFFNPVAKMPLVEIVAGEASRADALNCGQALIAGVDKLPLRVSSGPGFLVNRLLMPYMLRAATLFEEGWQREVIDAAARDFGMPMGPLELADRVGLDVCVAAADVMAQAQGLAVPNALRERIQRDELGQKSGRGFYQWRKGAPRKGRVAHGKAQLDALAQRLIEPFLDEAERARDAGVVADGDLVDAGAIFGTGFAPFTGGPLNDRRERGQTAQADTKAESQAAGETTGG
jgi:3-hydroxyacyl-CoA dehydrogenase/enoyl-CoA hydratase/3-hydroxybutyryl-CoA epimerase